MCVWVLFWCVCVFFSKVVSVYMQDPAAVYMTLYVSPVLLSLTVNLLHFIHAK